jgi:hypothetical protein
MRALAVWMLALSGCGGCNSDGLVDNPCMNLDEQACGAKAGCVADYCYECACTPSFVACRAASDPQTQCPQLGCAPACGCDGLDEAACQAAAPSLGCTAVSCPDCDGKLTLYAGCYGPTEGEPFCPPPTCKDRCRTRSDCGQIEECLAPGAQPGCGPCINLPTCTSDSDCSTGVCDVPECMCGPAHKSCLDGCDVLGCPAGQTCGSNLRCQPQACPCPANFDCTAAGTCARHPCSTDADCGGAFCVESEPFGATACFAQMGMCVPIPI